MRRALGLFGLVAACAALAPVVAPVAEPLRPAPWETTPNVSYPRLVRVVDDLGTPEPAWVFTIDRSMAAELTSEASVARCEAEIAAGATHCAFGEPWDCLSLDYTLAPQQDRAILLRVHPDQCRKSMPPSGAAYGVEGLERARIPMEPPRQ
jgi:hypothetical protein